MATAAWQRAHPRDAELLDRLGWLPRPLTTAFRNRITGEPDTQQPLYVPGLLGCPIYIEKLPDERFAHGASDWWQRCLTLREIQMLRVINVLTDLRNWNMPSFVDAWSETGLKMNLISHKTWDWCRRELHDLADIYLQKKFITVFDSSSRICKSDALIPPGLLTTLQSTTAMLQNSTSSKIHDCTSDLVDPSMFPFVHGRTRVLLDGTQVPLNSSTNFVGRGQITDPHMVKRPYETRLREMAGELRHNATKSHFYRCSERFQWLPCDVQFTKNNQSDVEILSYINNLHPGHNRPLYQAIEAIISRTIEPWNEVLAYTNKPRTPPRIRSYDVVWGPEMPSWADEDLLKRLDKMTKDEKEVSPEYQKISVLVEEYMGLPNHERSSEVQYHDDYQRQSLYIKVQKKYKALYHWEHPEPGDSFTYDEWKKGQSGRAIIGKSKSPGGEPCVDPDHEFYDINLRDKFKESGLQVIVRIASINVDQQAPDYPGAEWRVNGFLNEHIVATSLIFFDVQGITESSMSFRVEADLDPCDHHYKGFNFQEIADMYGFEYDHLEGGDALQELGQIKIVQGRMIAYPNTLQHKWDAFQLAPGASAGHMRYLEIHLIDPHYRLVSTANVPPQQHDWWYEAVAGRIDWAKHKMPPEIVHNILDKVGEWPMGVGEACQIKSGMDEERNIAMEAVMGGVVQYYFYH